MFKILKKRWNDIDPVHKDSFIITLWVIGAILIFIGFVWLTGDKAEELIRLLFSWAFFFAMGIVFGLHRAETMRREAEKRRQIEEEYKRTHSD